MLLSSDSLLPSCHSLRFDICGESSKPESVATWKFSRHHTAGRFQDNPAVLLTASKVSIMCLLRHVEHCRSMVSCCNLRVLAVGKVLSASSLSRSTSVIELSSSSSQATFCGLAISLLCISAPSRPSTSCRRYDAFGT